MRCYAPGPRGYGWDMPVPVSYGGSQMYLGMATGMRSSQVVPEQYEYGQEPHLITVNSNQEFNSTE